MTAKKKTAIQSGDVLFVPLNKLKKSPKNARKTPHPKADIEALAASIAAKGLLQNLVVEPERDKSGKETGHYLVTIGEGRRLAQLLRAKRKEVKKDEPVRCVLNTEHSAHEISLAENIIRSNMHPADQYEAFAALHRDEGLSAEDIAARFGVTAAVVKQRLRLGAISPKLIQAYREGRLNLDQLTAFAITDDHAAQERVWSELSFNKSREMILKLISEGQVPSDDRRAEFVGAKAYRAAGGVIVRDLFDEDGGGFFTDAALLNRLVREKLQGEAQKLLAEGWKWVAVEPEYDYELTANMRRIHPGLGAEDQAKLDALEARCNELADADSDTPESEAELTRLESEIEALQEKEQYCPEDITVAGAFVALGHEGEPRIERGFIRKEDEAQASATSDEGQEPETEDARGEADGFAPLSERLVAELTSYRTSALRNRLAQTPDIALLAVVHALAAAAFFPHVDKVSCLEIGTRSASLWTHAPGIAESPAEVESAESHERWAKRMPEQPEELWTFIAGLGNADLLGLLAHCASLTVNAIRAPGHCMDALVQAHADTLAEVTALDMTGYWRPTVESYFGRVSKDRIVQAVREGHSDEAAERIISMKKQAMAEAAQAALAGRGWLPALLRGAKTEEAEPEPMAMAAE